MTTEDKPDQDTTTDEDTQATGEEARGSVPPAGDTSGDASEEKRKPSVGDFKVTTPDGEEHSLGDIAELGKELGGQVKEALKKPGKDAINKVEETGADVVGRYVGMALDGAKSAVAGFLGGRGVEKK